MNERPGPGIPRRPPRRRWEEIMRSANMATKITTTTHEPCP
jgi:hypothetical protein